MIKRNLIANYLGQGLSAFVGIAFIPIYTKYLGIEAYGLIGMLSILQVWLGLLDLGMSTMIAREMGIYSGGGRSEQKTRDLLRSVEVLITLLALIFFAALAIASGWIASEWFQNQTLPNDVVADALIVMGAVASLRLIEGLYRSALIGLQRQVILNVISTGSAVTRAIGAIVVIVFLSPTVEAFFLWQGLISLLTTVLMGAATYDSLPKSGLIGQFSRETLLRVRGFTGGMAVIMLLWTVASQVDKIFLSKLLPMDELGYYLIAVAVSNGILMLVQPLGQAYYPRFCELYSLGKKDEFVDSFHKAAQTVSVITGSTALVFIFFGDLILLLWTQDSNLARRVFPLMQALSLGALLSSLTWIPSYLQWAHGITKISLYLFSIVVVLILPLIFFVVPTYGAMGAAWVWVGLNLLILLIAPQLMFNVIFTMERWKWIFADVLFPLSSAALVITFFRSLISIPSSSIQMGVILVLALGTSLLVSGLSTPMFRLLICNTLKKF